MVILFSTKYFLFVYMYIDLLKLKAYLKIVKLTSTGFFFKEANLSCTFMSLNTLPIDRQNLSCNRDASHTTHIKPRRLLTLENKQSAQSSRAWPLENSKTV